MTHEILGYDGLYEDVEPYQACDAFDCGALPFTQTEWEIIKEDIRDDK